MANPPGETLEELDDRIQAAAAQALLLPPNDIHTVRRQNIAANTKARVILHLEERLAAYDLYPDDVKKKRRREFATDLYDAAVAVIQGANQ